MPIQVKTIKRYRATCPSCSWESSERDDRETVSEELKRHQRSSHSAAARKRRAEEGQKIVEQLKKEGY